MRIGFALPQFGGAAHQADQVAGFARGVEAMGGDSLWVGDRLLAAVNPSVGYGGGSWSAWASGGRRRSTRRRGSR